MVGAIYAPDMLEALGAIGAVVALGVAAWPNARVLVAPAALGASGLSLTVSVVGLLGEGRSSGWLSLFESFALLALVFFTVRRAPPRLGAVAAVLAAAAAVTIIPSHATASSGSVLENAAGMGVWGFGALVAAGAARYLDALDARRARSVADARREQRLSLARDLHDFVAHDVSAIVVQAQAARVVGEREPGQALAALDRIEQAGLHALSAMDRAVEALRDATPAAHTAPPHAGPAPHGPGHGLVDVRALAARFEATGSVRVDVDMDVDDADALPSEVAGTIYRLVTEALTNVRRHAPGATRVEVRVTRSQARAEPAITVCVTNDGLPSQPTTAGALSTRAGGGFGLGALREHVEALGGTLQAGPDQNGGWQLKARLPLRWIQAVRG